MDLTRVKNIKKLLKTKGLSPLKQLGQNFLIDQSIVAKIISAANITNKDIILEIGPGPGILTKELAKKAKKVIAIEKDQKMANLLKENLKEFNNIEIINDDILKTQLLLAEAMVGNSFKIVSNLPFYITAPAIRLFLENENPPTKIVLIVQKEVAERICASPSRMSILSNSVQLYAQPTILSFVTKESFWPKPKVDSAILKISNIQKPKINTELFFKIVKAGFSQPRKQLINNFSRGLKLSRQEIENWLAKNKIDPKQRAQTLSVQNWISLTKTFCYNKPIK